jgi:phenylpropionate dioxygenase-like ring-hydroxylating dioxygenase large terminal subunit
VFLTPPLPDAWFIACPASQLRDRPLAVTIEARPLVLFRGGDGQVVALTDRCPHRNVPLSMGTVQNGTLQCAYHGWRFSTGGACVAVPGLRSSDVSLKSRCAEWWATRELDGFIWVFTTPQVLPAGDPPRFPHLEDARYTTVRREFFVEAPVHAVIENTLDVPHTAYLHGGLFRTPSRRVVIDVEVRRHPTWAEARFVGEPAPTGLVGRLLAPRGGVVEHTDRFLLPSLAQVEYRLGESHFIATSALTPVTPATTRVFAVVTFRLPLPGWLVKPFVAPVATRIFQQDRVMLRRQTEQVERFGGERFTSTELDVLGPQVARLLKQASLKEAPSTGIHEHRLQMEV